MGKTKLLKVTREAPLKEAAVDPCGVCGKRVGSNSVQCRLCNKWVHGRCSGTTGSLKRIAGVFECKVCKKGGRKQLDQFKYDEVELECVGEFCYLGDMLNDKGGVERAAIARVKSAWLKFRSLSGILCTRGMSWKMKGLVYKVCVRSVLTYGAETWAMKADVLARLRGTERRMMRMMTGVSLRDRVQSTEIGAKLGVNDLEEHMRRARLRWAGHVWRMDESALVRKALEMKVEGSVGRGRPMKRWIDVVKEDMRKRGLVRGDAENREFWQERLRLE